MRRTTFGDNVPEPKRFAAHVERRLEEYYQEEPLPNDAQSAFLASNLGVELWHLEVWFHHRRERDSISNKLATMKLKEVGYEATSGPRMILPADLNQLLEISLPGDALLFDLRSSSEYERSHIYGAIHLRAPRSFLQAAPLDLIERAIPDEQGRRQLSRWPTAKCIIFYGRGLELPWECPAAEIMEQKLREHGWTGQSFILRGHYREFGESFDKYIVGTKMTQDAKDWVSSQVTKLTTDTDRQMIEEQYSSWLEHVDNEDRARPLSTSPTQTTERFDALANQEQDLEAEFKARSGDLFSKAMDIQMSSVGGDAFESKAGMVEYLDRGLDKMRAAQAFPLPTSTFAPGHTKIPSDEYSDGYFGKRHEQDVEAEYVDVSKDGSTDMASPSQTAGPSEVSVPGDNSGSRGSGLLNKMFRR
jgi:hypothetical protein